MFVIINLADTNIAGCFVDIDFGVGRRNLFPLGVGSLWGNEVRKFRHRVKEADGGVSGKIRCEKTEMKIGPTKRGAG